MIPRVTVTLVAALIALSASSGEQLGSRDDLPETAFQLTCGDATIAFNLDGVEVTSAIRRWIRYDILRTRPAFSITYDGGISMQVVTPTQSSLSYTLWSEETEDGRKLFKFRLGVEGDRRRGEPLVIPPVPGDVHVRFPKNTDVMPGFVNAEHRAHDNYVDYFGGRSNRVARYFCAPEQQISAYSPEEIGVRCEQLARHYHCEPLSN